MSLLRTQRRISFSIHPIFSFGRHVATQTINSVVRCDVLTSIVGLVQRPTPAVAPYRVIGKASVRVFDHHEPLFEPAGRIADTLTRGGSTRLRCPQFLDQRCAVGEFTGTTIGFGSARALNKSFQRHYDCTPNEFRRRLQSANSAWQR